MLNPGIILQDRYEITRLLGQGGFGAVYQARDLHLRQRAVAVKENSGGEAEQFEREALLLAELNHPNLPRVTDHFVEPNGTQYLVMDFIDGQNLETLVYVQGALPEFQVLNWFAEILDAAEYLHNNNVIHRDIKPSNIIVPIDPNIESKARVMLVDFGIAKIIIDEQITATAKAATPGYAAPEQFSGGTDHRTDIYALGATLYRLVTGRVPPDARVLESGAATLTPPRWLNPNMSDQTEQIIMRAMDLSPSRRFQSIAEMRSAFQGKTFEIAESKPRFKFSTVALAHLGRMWLTGASTRLRQSSVLFANAIAHLVSNVASLTVSIPRVRQRGTILLAVGGAIAVMSIVAIGLVMWILRNIPLEEAFQTSVATGTSTLTITLPLQTEIQPTPISTPAVANVIITPAPSIATASPQIPSSTRTTTRTITPTLTNISAPVAAPQKRLDPELARTRIHNNQMEIEYVRGVLATDASSGVQTRIIAIGESNYPIDSPIFGVNSTAWSADGKRILVSFTCSFPAGFPGVESSLMQAVNPDASATFCASSSSGHLGESPIWSPDGRRIAFRRGPCQGCQEGLYSQGCIYVANTDFQNQRKLDQCEFQDYPRFWSTDGKWILVYFSGQEGGPGAGMFALEADGNRRVSLTQLLGIKFYDQRYYPWREVEKPNCVRPTPIPSGSGRSYYFWTCQ